MIIYTKFNFKCQITITKFIMDIKKLEGVDNKRTRTHRLIVIDVEKIKTYLLSKYKIEFPDKEDENNDVESPLDIII